MKTIHTFLFIKDKGIERKVLEYLLRYKSINIKETANDDISFIERYQYHSYDMLIIDLTENYTETLSILESINKPILTLAIISQTELTYHMLNKGIFDVITKNFTSDLLLKKISRVRKTIELLGKSTGDSGIAAEEKSIYKNRIDKELYSFLKNEENTSVRVILNDIMFITCENRRLSIETEISGTYFKNDSLKNFAISLPINLFARVNNCTIVNINKINKIDKEFIYIKEHKFKISRIYGPQIRSLLGL